MKMNDGKEKLLLLKKSLERERDELKKFLVDFHNALEKASSDDMMEKVKAVVEKHDTEKKKK